MKKQALAALAMMMTSGAAAQTFSLDDLPAAPITSAFYPGLFSAEDPFGLGLPATVAGLVGPSPTLITVSGVTSVDGTLLTVVPAIPTEPVLDVPAPLGTYLNAVSQDHEKFYPEVSEAMNIRFSVDRATTGLPGSPLAVEAGFSQQPGDIYISEALFPNPGVFVGTLGGAPFAGVLPTAAVVAGTHLLEIDESKLNLTAGLGAGVFLPPAVPAPAIGRGTHDNVDAYNVLPDRTMDLDGDGINDRDYFFSINPGDASAFGLSAASIFAVPAGAGGGIVPAWAPASMLGLNGIGFPPNTQLDNQLDDVDGLVVWDFGDLNTADIHAEPGRDYAIFSLSERSASLAALRSAGFPVDGSTIFYTDFTGSFAVYLFGSQLGIADLTFGDQQLANLDALEICAEIQPPCDPCVLVDVNGDGIVNASDFTAWINAFNNNLPGCDQNCDGVCTPADFTAWIANFNACP